MEFSSGTVQVWQIDLGPRAPWIESCRRLLSDEEIQRADRFVFEQHRSRFVAGRAAIRVILWRYLDITPERIRFSYGENGKPELAGGPDKSCVRFNLSHSHDKALLAVVRHSRVGADIEFIDRQCATEEVAAKFFSSYERNALRELSPEQRATAFYSCWTRKEAYIKAIGAGLSLPLDSFDVAFGPGIPPALLRVESFSGQVSRWTVYDVQAPQGYAATIVVEGGRHLLEHQHWEWSLLSASP